MSRQSAPKNLKALFSLRIANIPDELKTEDLIADCKVYGAIGDFYRPTNLHRRKPSTYAFVRYLTQDDADNAKACLQGKQYGDHLLSVFDANQQNSFFTQDTGFITNEMFDVPKIVVDNFNGSMPPTHYEMKRKQELLLRNDVYSVRVSDIPLDIKKPRLEELFCDYGDISSICYPMDLHTLLPRGFAFIRYVRADSARRAVEGMNGCTLGTGRGLSVSLVGAAPPSYFSQDETPLFNEKKKNNFQH